MAETASKGRILVVGDDASARSGLERLLQQEHFAVRTAADGAAALKLAAEFAPDAVVTDLHMPEMDGMELLQRLREQDPGLPVVVATGSTDVSSAIGAVRAGADDYLTKPIDFDALLLTLERATERRALRTETENLRRQARQLESEGDRAPRDPEYAGGNRGLDREGRGDPPGRRSDDPVPDPGVRATVTSGRG